MFLEIKTGKGESFVLSLETNSYGIINAEEINVLNGRNPDGTSTIPDVCWDGKHPNCRCLLML